MIRALALVLNPVAASCGGHICIVLSSKLLLVLLIRALWARLIPCYYTHMVNGIAIVFLLLATAFSVTHVFAMFASLYWYYWWFDIVMHFWGGGLIVLGVHALSTFSCCSFRPTITVLLVVLVSGILFWEVFEFWADLWQPERYLLDTLGDVLVGLCGGVVAHAILRTNNLRKV